MPRCPVSGYTTRRTEEGVVFVANTEAAVTPLVSALRAPVTGVRATQTLPT
jgi:hypothetical protein